MRTYLAATLLLSALLCGCVVTPDMASVPSVPPAGSETPHPRITRVPVTNFINWERVRDSEQVNPSFTESGIAGADEEQNEAWLQLAEEVAESSSLEKARQVNIFFNKMPYVEDGEEDYWAKPWEFMENSGDCEDFAIVKYFALRYLGIPSNQLRIAGVWNEQRKQGHAVLLFLEDRRKHVLDNLSDELLLIEAIPHYKTCYEVNENYLWADEKVDCPRN